MNYSKYIFMGIFALFVLVTCGMYGCPQYSVYHQRMEGEAELAKANYSKQVQVQEAKAGMESAGYKAKADSIRAEGVMLNVGFNPERLAANKQNILDLLSGLPDPFRKSAGGGWSFLQACVDREGNHWAEHQTIDKLLVLGLASKQASLLVGREMWGMFPGGMPYFQIEL